MKIVQLGLFLLLVASCATGGDQKLGPRDGTDLPPADLERVQIGKPAPDFTLESKDGDLVMLSSYKGKKNVLLVFYRGYW